MRFYEIHEPYYALIKAKDEIDATQKYIEIVAGSDKEFEEIREEMNIVEKDYVTRILAHSTDDNTGEKLTNEELKRAINEEITDVLLIDGILL